MSDADLIFLIQRGSKAAETVFYQRYSVYARHAARKYHAEFKESGISEDELYAVAFSKTHESLTKWDGKNNVYYVYWKHVVRNAIYDYVRENSYTLGAKPLGDISIDDYRNKDYLGLIVGDPYSELERAEDIKEFLKPYLEQGNNLLSEDEKLIVKLKVFEECSRTDLVKLTGMGKNRVNYLIKTALGKIQKLLKENYL